MSTFFGLREKAIQESLVSSSESYDMEEDGEDEIYEDGDEMDTYLT